jgi:tetratricopeptide (TPR) repeat protein
MKYHVQEMCRRKAMSTQKQLALVAMMFVLLNMFFGGACDGTGTAGGPRPPCNPGEDPVKDDCIVCPPASPATPAPAAPAWERQIDAGKNAEVIQDTTTVIKAGKVAPEYAQALLYRGVAKSRLGELKDARDDLASAQSLTGQMSKDERTLLFRTQMVVLAKLGDNDGANQAFKNALDVAAEDQKDAIRKEYDALKLQ